MKKRILLHILLTVIFSLNASTAISGSATLSWDPPTTNTDGTPLTDLAGYRVYYGTSSRNYPQNINVGNVTTYTVDNLADGFTYYFTVTAYNTSGNESIRSNEVSETIQSSQQNTLSVNKGGTGTGIISSSPAGISCGSDCKETYNANTVVTLTVLPDASSTFAGWSGTCSGTGTCSVNMDAAKTVTATFTLKTYTITASAGTGGTISPSGSVSVINGISQTLTFTITANAGYNIADVVVDNSSVGAVSTYSFSNVTANHTISASFTATPYTMTVTKTGTGSGTVTSSPAGISCGSDCKETYNANTVVTLTVLPDASSTFAGWSGTCSGTGTCSVNMDAAKTVTATFTLKTYTITASAGTGGTISPSGSVSVINGANQTFTITPNSDYHVSDVLIDGLSVGVDNIYITFTNVTANHTIAASFAPGSEANSADIPQTGQRSSYATGDDGYIQAGVEWPNPRFTDNGDGTITDNLTDLVWLKDGGCLVKNWDYALKSVSEFNTNPVTYNCLGYTANYSDWRLPNVKELESLINYGVSDPSRWLLSEGFVKVSSSYYWSSSTPQDRTSQAWLIKMSNGYKIIGNKTKNYYVLPVRAGKSVNPADIPQTGQRSSYATGDDGYIQAGVEWPNPRFTDNGDGTITDNLTDLMWLKDGGCLMKTWDYALKSVSEFNTNPANYNCSRYSANYTDWRLPNVKELESLINYGVSDPSRWLLSEGFVKVSSSYYWSSSTSQSRTSEAWSIKMSDGYKVVGNKNKNYYVLPVRAGKIKGNQ